MSSWAKLEERIRRLIRREAPRAEAFRVVSTTPLRLESQHRSLTINAADDDVTVIGDVQALQVKATVVVFRDRSNDYVVVVGGGISGAVWGYYVPDGQHAYIPEGMFGVTDDGEVEVDGELEVDGRMIEV